MIAIKPNRARTEKRPDKLFQAKKGVKIIERRRERASRP
jgi:hypothetical protein